MFELIQKGGPVMIPIIVGSILGLAIVLERLWYFREVSRMNSYEFIQQIFKYLKTNKIQQALELCGKNSRHPVAAVFKIGLERYSLPPERLEKILEQSGNHQVERLEKYLGALASIISIEPLLGFLGTITGLIRAFMSWEKLGANVTVNALAGGMYEAMITTAAGLIVAIPLFLFYNYFINRIKHISSNLTNHGIQLIEILAEMKSSEKEVTRP
jgi:biopolymer transport protein ExbB